MNRLGIIIDIAGLDDSILDEVLSTTVAPVIAMGVGLRNVVNNKINMDYNIVDKFKAKNGLLMLTTDCNLFSTDPPNCKIDDFTNLLNATRIAGVKVAFGGVVSSEGKHIEDLNPQNLSKYYDTLFEKGFSMDFLRGLAMGNFLSLFKAVEDKSKELTKTDAEEAIFDFKNLLKNKLECYTGLDPTPTSKPIDPSTNNTDVTTKTTDVTPKTTDATTKSTNVTPKS